MTGSKGSSPRNSGAKFIVLPNGEFFGTVGGGRLEELVIEDSLNCLEEAISDSHKYGLCGNPVRNDFNRPHFNKKNIRSMISAFLIDREGNREFHLRDFVNCEF